MTEGRTDPQGESAHLVYFFFPLPEAVQIPSDVTFQTSAPMSVAELRNHHDHLPDDHGEADLRPRTISSIRVWPTTIPRRDFLNFTVASAIKVARQAIPTLKDLADQDVMFAEDDMPQTVVEVAVVCADFSEDSIDAAFSVAVEAVQSIQRAFYLASRAPLTFVTQENVSPFILMGKREATGPENGWPEDLDVYIPNPASAHAFTELELTEPQIEAFFAVLSGGEKAPFLPFAELVADGRHALFRRGDYRGAAFLLYSASEVLLDTLLLHMLWEEKRRPEDVARDYFPETAGFATRLARHYHDRLRGNWTTKGYGNVAVWHRDLVTLRHRVVHAGYRPTRDEGYSAYDAYLKLEEFLVERVTHRRFIERYPRTALALRGRPGLEWRGRWMDWLNDLLNDPDEPLWQETFGRWRGVVNAMRGDAQPLPVRPDDLASVLVMDAEGREGWWLHDTVNRLVRPCETPSMGVDQRAIFDTVRQEFLLDANPEDRASVVWVGGATKPLPGTNWRREHEVLPLHGVMLDGTDYTTAPDDRS